MVDELGLAQRGQALWGDITQEYGEPQAEKLHLLIEACRLADQMEALEAILKADGYVVNLPGGNVKRHPADTALKDARSLFLKTLAALELPEEV
ncbi:P27 family phage terminase small subunit [Spirillospora sp. CA-253888]